MSEQKQERWHWLTTGQVVRVEKREDEPWGAGVYVTVKWNGKSEFPPAIGESMVVLGSGRAE